MNKNFLFAIKCKKYLKGKSILLMSLLFACQAPIDYKQQSALVLNIYTPSLDYVQQGKLQEALDYCDSVCFSTKNPNVLVKLYRYEFKISIIDQQLSRNYLQKSDAVIKYMDSAIYLIERHKIQKNIPDKYVKFLLLKAEALFQLHEPEMANQLFYFVENFGQKNKDASIQFQIADKIAFIAFRQKQFQQAINYFKKGLYYFKQHMPNDYYKITETIDNIAISFDKMNKNDSAIHYYRMALAVLDLNKDKIVPNIKLSDSKVIASRSRGVVLGNLANVYARIGKIDSAILLSKESIAINSNLCCEQRDAQIVQMRLIDMYANENDWINMFSQLTSLRKGLDSLPNSEPESNYYRQMAFYYEGVKEPAKALPNIKLYTKLRDSINSATGKDAESNIIKDLQIKSQEGDLILLKKDNQLNKLYLWVTIGLIAMAVVIITMVFFNYKKSKVTNSVLSKLNEAINQQKTALEKANADKDRVMNAVAHDLRNPIGAIANFLEIVQVKYEHSVDESKILNNSQQAAVRSLQLINDLLEVNQMNVSQ